MAVDVRSARAGDGDAVAGLLYLSASGMYDRFAGGRDAALALLRRSFDRSGTSASAEIAWVALDDGRVIGALAGFPIAEGERRTRAFLRVTLGTLPPWRWPAALRLYRLGVRITPPAPQGSFYIDGLATDPGLRRRGAARALLGAAEDRARVLGLHSLSLDTSLDNEPARAPYESCGFEPTHRADPAGGIPGLLGYVKPLRPPGAS